MPPPPSDPTDDQPTNLEPRRRQADTQEGRERLREKDGIRPDDHPPLTPKSYLIEREAIFLRRFRWMDSPKLEHPWAGGDPAAYERHLSATYGRPRPASPEASKGMSVLRSVRGWFTSLFQSE